MFTNSSKMMVWLGGCCVAAMVAGCGGAPAEPATGEPHGDPHGDHHGEPHGDAHGDEHAEGEHDPHAEHGREEHPEMTEGMHAFHEVMAPLWHADEKSPTRFDDTCKAVDEMNKLGAAIGEEPAPEGKDAEWKSAGETLVTTLKDLGALCEPKNEAEFQAKFSLVHDAFHAQMELRGGKKHESK